MNQDRTDKRKPADQRERQPGEPQAQSSTGEKGEKGERKPSQIERREWRGAGVCGDRHTD